MEDPAKKDGQLDDASESRIDPSESVSWLSFDGKEGLSCHEFVQKVQRTAFQQGKQRDDEWVADFAATSFSGEALEWYVGLDEETQTSWRKLCAGLIQRWPIKPGTISGGEADLDPASFPLPPRQPYHHMRYHILQLNHC
ncbi:hypothetical protein FRC01_008483 [Tulasnella sp. 417]|nr:hypothetical protein FRC01_008483 [Tulasnella sp. 417]